MTSQHIYSAMNWSFKILNGLLVGATIYFVASIAARLLQAESPKILGIPVSQENAIFVLLLGTILHVGVLRYIVHYARLSWIHLNREERTTLYLQLTGGQHPFTHGAERLRDEIRNVDGILSVRVQNEDPPSMLHWAVFFIAVLAGVRYELSFQLVWTFAVGMTLAMANWQIGSSWLVIVADLGRHSNQSLYFPDLSKGALDTLV